MLNINTYERRTINKWMPLLFNLNYKGNKYCELCLYCEYSSWEYENTMRKIFSWWGTMHNLGGVGLFEVYDKQQQEMKNYKGEVPQNSLSLSLKILTKMEKLNDFNVDFNVLSDNEVTEYVIDINTDFEMDEKDFEYNEEVGKTIINSISSILDKKISSIIGNKSVLNTIVFNTKWLVKSYKMKDKKTISVTLSYGLIKNNG